MIVVTLSVAVSLMHPSDFKLLICTLDKLLFKRVNALPVRFVVSFSYLCVSLLNLINLFFSH